MIFVYCDGLGRLYLYLYLYLFVFICCVFVLLPIFSVNKDLYIREWRLSAQPCIGSFGRHESVRKTYLGRFDRFCRAQPFARHIHTDHASASIARIYRVVRKSGHPIYFCYNFSK